METRFRDERMTAAVTRTRVMCAAAMLVAAAIGWQSAGLSARLSPEYITLDLQLRFLVVVPAWFTLFALTFLPVDRRRNEWANIAMTVLACWGLALKSWHHSWYFRYNNSWGTTLSLDLLAALIISAYTLPFRFRQITGATLAGLGGAWIFCRLTLPATRLYDLNLAGGSFVGMGLLVLALSWWRESGDRAMFAQREHARRLAQQLAESNAELARITAEQAEFMAIAAHDLRSPLAVVRGLAELMEAGQLTTPDAQRKAVEEIRRQTTRMLGLVSDYLGAQAAEGRAAEVRIRNTDLTETVRSTVARHEASARAKEQSLAGPPPGESVIAAADEALLAQVLDNFVSNAVKFSPRGATVRLAIAPSAAGWRVAVSDSGPGIAREEQAGLFRKFGRASTRPTGGEASHGLGLAVAKRLAEAMRARVGCDSEVGRGATFWIELPRAIA